MLRAAARRTAEGLAVVGAFFSYTNLGFRARSRRWGDGQLEADMSGRLCVVTGANAGLGRAAAEALVALGAEVICICRNRARGEEAVAAMNAAGGRGSARLEVADLGQTAEVLALGERLRRALGRLDVLVHNAGVMVHQRELTSEGLETTFAINALAGFALTVECLPLLAATPGARVIHMTSGGMYSQRLAVDDLQFEREPFDGVEAYAQTKRMQVVLNEAWAPRLAPLDVTSNATHPGWAATPGVARSLPTFDRVVRRWLRTPAQGADSAVWLAVSPEAADLNGQLVFDRKPRPQHLFAWTRESKADGEALWRSCEQLAGYDPGEVDARLARLSQR